VSIPLICHTFSPPVQLFTKLDAEGGHAIKSAAIHVLGHPPIPPSTGSVQSVNAPSGSSVVHPGASMGVASLDAASANAMQQIAPPGLQPGLQLQVLAGPSATQPNAGPTTHLPPASSQS